MFWEYGLKYTLGQVPILGHTRVRRKSLSPSGISFRPHLGTFVVHLLGSPLGFCFRRHSHCVCPSLKNLISYSFNPIPFWIRWSGANVVFRVHPNVNLKLKISWLLCHTWGLAKKRHHPILPHVIFRAPLSTLWKEVLACVCLLDHTPSITFGRHFGGRLGMLQRWHLRGTRACSKRNTRAGAYFKSCMLLR